MFAGYLSLLYDLFYELERQNILHPDNDGHLWCLHYVFLPIINKHLTNWKNAWVYHPIRTEKNKSPMQLWIRGLQEAWGSQSLEDEVFQVLYEVNFCTSRCPSGGDDSQVNTCCMFVIKLPVLCGGKYQQCGICLHGRVEVYTFRKS